MTTEKFPGEAPKSQDAERAPWLALIVIVLAQIQMSFNINALPVLVGPITKDLATPATNVATALVVYALVVAALVMVGAKVGRLLGERLVFQAGVILHAVAMGMMAFSTDVRMMNYAQAVAGLAAVAVALISFGFNNLNAWGLVLAKPAAPFSLVGLSPAPFMEVLGIVLGQAFFAWSHRRHPEANGHDRGGAASERLRDCLVRKEP